MKEHITYIASAQADGAAGSGAPIDGYAEYLRDRANDATEVRGGEVADPGQLRPRSGARNPDEDASGHVANALAILRTASEGFMLSRDEVAAIGRRLTWALEALAAEQERIAHLETRNRTLTTMLDDVVKAVGLDDAEWHISDVLKAIAGSRASRGFSPVEG